MGHRSKTKNDEIVKDMRRRLIRREAAERRRNAAEAIWRNQYPGGLVDWLETRTGLCALDWVGIVQRAIREASGPARVAGKYKGHSMTDVDQWIAKVTRRVIREAGIKRHKDRDENMGLAAVLGMVLVAWYVRLHRAKAFDPNRPVELRKKALAQVNVYVGELVRVCFKDSMDPFAFPGQEFENPYVPNARDGKFI